MSQPAGDPGAEMLDPAITPRPAAPTAQAPDQPTAQPTGKVPARRFPKPLVFAGGLIVGAWLIGAAWAGWSLSTDADPSGGAVSAAFARATSDIALLSEEIEALRGRLAVLEAAPAETASSRSVAEGETSTSALAGADDAGVVAAAADPVTAAIEADAGLAELVAAGAPPAGSSNPELFTGGADIYSCSDFTLWDDAQAVLIANQPGDPNLIDTDGDGIACERLLGGPSDLDEPSAPSEPEEPSAPSEPTAPSEPSDLGEPSAPSEPTAPSEPSDLGEPSAPSAPSEPEEPSEPSE